MQYKNERCEWRGKSGERKSVVGREDWVSEWWKRENKWVSESKKKKRRIWKTNGHNVRGILQDKQERIDMNEWMNGKRRKGRNWKRVMRKETFFLKKNFKKREREKEFNRRGGGGCKERGNF